MDINLMKEMEFTEWRKVAEVFIDGYYDELKIISKDKETLNRILVQSFNPETIYVARTKGEVVGMVGCSNDRTRCLKIEKNILVTELGKVKGTLFYYSLNKEFSLPMTTKSDQGYIECVATKKEARGKGVSKGLFSHVLQQNPYSSYRLEVTDTNTVARAMYEKLHFKEVERKKEKLRWFTPFNERIYMERSSIEKST